MCESGLKIISNQMAIPTIMFTSIRPSLTNMLWPAPNVLDWEHIGNATSTDPMPRITDTDFMISPMKILTDYRGTLLFVEGGIQVYRVRGAGVYYPIIGSEEEVYVRVNGKEYIAQVKYV